jgi:hypothetical protein
MAFFNPKSLLMLDSCRAHITPEIKTTINKYSKMAIILGGLTKKLQPLDIAVNKPFKDQLQAKRENWMMGGIHEYNKTGQMKRLVQRYSGMDCRKLGCCKLKLC